MTSNLQNDATQAKDLPDPIRDLGLSGQELLDFLRDPRKSLPRYGTLIEQSYGQRVRYNPYAITKKLQATVLQYYANPPKNSEGYNKWMVLLGYRQAGKSLAVELAAYAKAAYTPGYDHVCMADKRERAEYLHERVHLNHENWPEDYRSPAVGYKETRKKTFEKEYGGRMRTLSADGHNEGIGQSVDSFHGSEIPFWPDPGSTMNLVIPSMINRREALVIMESTPAPGLDEPVIYFRDLYQEGKYRRGRWLGAFFPFWDGLLNRRRYSGERLTDEELDLMHRYGPQGLTEQNLMFRREMFETDIEIRRNPNLFRVFYPFDDMTCWLTAVGAVIPHSILDKIDKAPLREWDPDIGYIELEAPEPGAVYACGVDPAGYGMRDHASFHILKVFDDEWKQVYSFGKNVDPPQFIAHLLEQLRRYGNPFTAVEKNGVGAAVLAALEQVNYPRIIAEGPGQLGITATVSNNDRHLQYLVEALQQGLLNLQDADTLAQLYTYRNDKRVERSANALILSGGEVGKRRRERHHWDKVSALIMAVVAARFCPTRRRKRAEDFGEELDFEKMSYNQQREYLAKADEVTPKKDEPSNTVRSVGNYRVYSTRFKK
jgi:hypothetical protein